MNCKSLLYYLLTGVFMLTINNTMAQQKLLVNLSSIDGTDITPDNVLSYKIQSLDNKSSTVMVRGSIRYRNSSLSATYSFKCNISPGINSISAQSAHAQWQFSSTAFQELFFTHHVMPSGTYEYCVTADPVGPANEAAPGGGEECIYHQSDELFLINLISPENKAKLTEYYPMLNWVANYSFSNELTYRLRVAEMKQGQNPANAVARNQPVYDEKNLYQNSKIYPSYARPLVKDQPYAWTVDAYYKGILLGSAEAWQFIIKEDTLLRSISPDQSYIDIRREGGQNKIYAIGEIKLKYLEDRSKKEVLRLTLTDESNKAISLKTKQLDAAYGDNRYIINIKEEANLKHNATYTLQVENTKQQTYTIIFTYINPDFN